MIGHPDGTQEQDRFLRLLDEAAARSQTIAFWWRDDDAEDATPQLDTLLAQARKHALPLGLAVIPKRATAALAERLTAEPWLYVLQHGWAHQRHSPDGDKKMELGDHRPPDIALAELKSGCERLTGMFPAQFLPVLVPPWNRISEALAAQRRSVGLPGLSTFGPAPADEPNRVNTHLDVIDWAIRGPLPPAQLYAVLCREVQRRLRGDKEPIGILTHHLIHDPSSWARLDELLAQISTHAAISWPPLSKLFCLEPQIGPQV